MTQIIGIAAVGRNGVIGSDNDIPWRIPQDWRRFQQLTMGHVLIMGRKTFDSIGRPLPGRQTIVITRDRRWRGSGVAVAANVEDAFAQARALSPALIFVAGGGEIYRSCWDRLDRLEVTEVELEPAGSVTFPAIESEEWQETGREEHEGFRFVSYQRKQPQY